MGNENLLNGFTSTEIASSMISGFLVTSGILTIPLHNSYSFIASAAGGLTWGGMKFHDMYMLRLHETNIDPYRFSLSTGPQIDRAAALFALGKTQTLVKPI